ncbi:hypothetical protein [Paracoccus sp. (in: a-proteobacteria)]|uniref:hypothetical protein n=1 Tax=Paracoccus sp. TaxID=267 RepID=UPI002AFE9558|nr:hypothetical protein [Paracoccus sp. (in: a-proteobacteria)]
MLAAAALRLAAIEALCPTAAVLSGTGFPTLAEHRVYDSVSISPDDLQSDAPYTPAISLYTEDTVVRRRGATATSAIGFASADLIIVAELAELARDEDGKVITNPDGSDATDAVINGDARMRLALEALTSQVRAVLVRAPSSAGLRRVMKAASEIRVQPYALPGYGVRFMRNVITISAEIADDRYDDAAGFPEPMRSVAADLPAGSYARAELDRLAAAFRATTREQLESIGFAPAVNGQAVPGSIIQP